VLRRVIRCEQLERGQDDPGDVDGEYGEESVRRATDPFASNPQPDDDQQDSGRTERGDVGCEE
jgi:hypothetical protein